MQEIWEQLCCESAEQREQGRRFGLLQREVIGRLEREKQDVWESLINDLTDGQDNG